MKILLMQFSSTLVVSIFILPKALRVHKVKTLYDKDKIVYNFVNMDKIFPSEILKPLKIQSLSKEIFKLCQRHFLLKERRKIFKSI